MLAAQYVAGNGIEVADVNPRPPGHGEVQLEVAYVGICGTDLHILAGHMDDRVADHGVIGHEMSGRVAAVGEGVTGWSPGDPVTVMPLRWCGRCPTCRAGHAHICDRLDFVGIDSTGAMQQLWNVPQKLLVPLPPDLPLRAAALVEPVAVAHHDVVRAALSAGEAVLVVGGGPIGVLIGVLVRARGAKALLVEPDPYRRSVIEELGLDVLESGAAGLSAWLDAWSEGAGAAVTFEVSGTQAGLDLAVAALGARGRLVAVGIHAEPRQVDMKRVFWKELQILGARVYDRSDFTAAVDLLVQGVIPVDALVSRTEALADAPAAFVSLAQGGRVMKVLVDCGQGGST
jgi:(R,R)-butanediol dehydrogenase/meso-butanediol dehydrogenase/diacetyl reductase